MATDQVRRKAQKAAAARWAKAPDRTYDHDNTPTSRIRMLTRKQVADELGISEWTLWDWVRKSKFPKPVALSPGHPMKWRLVDVEIWLQRRMKKHEKAPLRGAVRKRMENK